MNKFIKAGRVAVLYHPDFGIGWSTANPQYAKELCMDERIVQAFLEGGYLAARRTALQLFPDAYLECGVLSVDWLYQDTIFSIEEYDGRETIRIHGSAKGCFIA